MGSFLESESRLKKYWLGLVAVGISVDIYAMVGECVCLYNGRGKAGRGTDSRTNDDRGKDVVPLRKLKYILIILQMLDLLQP